MRLTEAEIGDLRARNPVADVAEKLGARLRKSGRTMVGACPICGGNGVKSGRFECKTPETWVCAVCQDGGDVIRLVERVQAIDFRAAVEWLGGTQAIDPVEAARRDKERAKRDAKRIAEEARGWERERQALHALWTGAAIITRTPAEAYLAARGVLVAPHRLRYCDDVVYFHGMQADERGRQMPRAIHRGPVMLAPIVGPDGRFAGLHQTYLTGTGAKATIIDPDTGKVLSAKKVRGAMAGGYIALSRAKANASRLVIGEGIETVGSVATAEVDEPVWENTLYWSAISLGNLGGRAMGSLEHPSLKLDSGHPVRVPNAVPDLTVPAIRIPDQITELLLLGDGDSEPMLTRAALDRATARYRRFGRVIRIAWAPEGRDFNDVLQSLP